MAVRLYDAQFSGNAADNYERYFVPAIGAPLAADLVEAAALQVGERVLDVACGTGIVARLAAERIGETGRIAGADVNRSMLEVARALPAAGVSIEWQEADAESLPHADESFDAVLCQMGLQFVANKLAALREMRRVLVAGGRAVINVPGPAPAPMAEFADALGRHVGAQAAAFMHLVFSLHDADELRELLAAAGFREIDVRRATKALRVPPPEQFMWQYIYSTPMAGVLSELDPERRAALERDVIAKWRDRIEDGALILNVGMTTAIATK